VISKLFRTSATQTSPQDGNIPDGTADAQKVNVSDFVTVPGLANFALMTGVIFAAWQALQTVGTWADTRYVPFGFCLAYGVVSVLISNVAWSQSQDMAAHRFCSRH
jgi:hypothetical protein